MDPTADRDLLAEQLMARGSASFDEIMRASFGEWPPRGLDIVVSHEKSIRILPMQHFLPNAVRLGYWPILRYRIRRIRTTGAGPVIEYLKNFKAEKNSYAQNAGLVNGTERTIYINEKTIALRASLHGQHFMSCLDILGHEAVHVRQNDLRSQAVTELGWTAAASLLLSGNVTRTRDIASALFDQAPACDDGARRAEGLWPRSAYLERGREIQVRLHSALAKNYPSWPHMPVTPLELWAALKSSGLVLPPDMKTELASEPGWPQAQQQFTGNGKADSALIDLNTVQSSLPPDLRPAFWRETLPALYGDLLEHYGDRLGRARMGPGYNERLPWILLSPELKEAEQGLACGANWPVVQKLKKLDPKMTADFVISLSQSYDEGARYAVKAEVDHMRAHLARFAASIPEVKDELARRRDSGELQAQVSALGAPDDVAAALVRCRGLLAHPAPLAPRPLAPKAAAGKNLRSGIGL